jgi:predicted NAD/FAD-binding protein
VTYPWLRKLFGELDVQVRPTEMSMSVRCEGCGLEYAGGRGLRGVFAQPRRLLDPRYLRMLWQVKRFHRRALAFLRTTDEQNLTTYGEFLEREGFSGYFITHYAVPVVSCVWSAGQETALAYPARYLFRFLDHHGMLRAGGSPQWYSITGGSRVYVERLARLLTDVRAAHAVTDVTRHEDGVQIRDVTRQVTGVDRVVIATHADQALGLLTDPSDAEVTTLKQFAYSSNVTVLHTDHSVLPDAAQARASWNYRMTACHRPGQPAVVSYWMNRLQGHRAAQDFLVTLNDREVLDPESIVATMEYEHPIYTPEAVRAQSQLGGLATDRTVYAGAYHGWGFHEDGCRSGIEAARHFGVTW